MIAIVDYGIGNLGSVTKGFRYAGAETLLTGDPEELRRATALVLPGDGAFAASMEELESRGLVDPLLDAVRSGTPLLGICIGMQLLFEESHEHGRHKGLGLLPGTVERFSDQLVVPHMGWNALKQERAHALFDEIEEGAYVYFVHSYFCAPTQASDVIATSEYGGPFASVVGRDNVLGVQFHPEKSQEVGLRMVRNFVRLVEAGAGRAA